MDIYYVMKLYRLILECLGVFYNLYLTHLYNLFFYLDTMIIQNLWSTFNYFPRKETKKDHLGVVPNCRVPTFFVS